MESKKINQLATAVNPSTSDLAIIGDPVTGVSKKITWLQVSTLIGTAANLQQVTDNGATTTNPITIGGLTITGLSTGVLKSDSGVINSVPFGAANGVATLAGDGKVPSSQLPSYVDDVVEVANYAALPVTGETGKLYITLDNNKVYRWGGSVYVEVAANNGVWGSITGTLSNQTDLQNVLDLKATDSLVVHLAGTETITGTKTFSNPSKNDGGILLKNGASYSLSGYMNLGGMTDGLRFTSGGGISNYFALPSSVGYTYTFPAISGTIVAISNGNSTQYIDGTGSLQTFPTLLSSDKLVKLVRNQSGATMTAGTIVYISGATGNKPLITKALATGDATSAQTFGLVQANIANNADGYVVVIGNITDIDTSALTEGQQLYLSGTTAGAYTTTKPYAPIHLVYIGIVLRSHPTQGIIGVKIQNGYEMDELHNVDAYAPSNNDILSYNTTTSLWEHKQIATTLGFTPISLASLSATSPLIYNNATGAFSIQVATASQNGYLSSTDWSTFNNKQAALGGTGFVKISGSTISYDNSTYYLASNPSGYITLASLSAGAGISYSNITGVISSTITQYTDALARAAFSESVVGLDYSSSTGVLSTTTGYAIPTTSKQTEWDSAYTNRITSLTTTGTSGVATLIANTLNIPNYTYTLPTASTSVLGGVKVDGTTITINGSGVISGANTYSLPIATSSVLGGVKIGSGVSVDVNGVISVSTNYQAPLNGTGFVKAVGTTISYDNSTYLTTTSAASTYLPLIGGVLTGQLNITYSLARFIIGDGTSAMSFGLWDGVSNRIEASGTALNIISYGGIITLKRTSGSTLTIDTSTLTWDGNISTNNIYTPSSNSLSSGASIRLYALTDANWGIRMVAAAGTGSDEYHIRIIGSGTLNNKRQFQVIDSGASNAVRFAVNFDGTGTYAGTIVSGVWNGTAIGDSYISSAATWNAKQSTITLTTTGSSGASTFSSNILNIPNYTLAGLGGQTALNGTGFVKAVGTTISYDNTAYLPLTAGITKKLTGDLFIQSDEPQIYLEKTGTGAGTWRILGSTGASLKRFRIYDEEASSDRLVIHANGNVGINEANDQSVKFYVNGTGKFSSSITANIITSTSSGSTQLFLKSTGGGTNRDWQFQTNETAAGDFSIMQSTTAGGSTYATKFNLTAAGGATLYSTLNVGGVTDIQSARTTQLTLLKLSTTTLSSDVNDEVSIDIGRGGMSKYSGRISGYLSDYSTYDGGLRFYSSAAGVLKTTAQMQIHTSGTISVGSTAVGTQGLLQVYGNLSLGGSSNYNWMISNTNDANWGFGMSNTGSLYFPSVYFAAATGDGDNRGFRVMNVSTSTRVLFVNSVGTLTASGDVVAYSDIRFKENIRPIENVLNRINESRGVLYDRKDSGLKNNIGFIAQELELQFPELVNTDNEGIKSVKYSNAVAILFEAVKEQQKQINELKKQIA